MSRIQMDDLPVSVALSQDEMQNVAGGRAGALSPTLELDGGTNAILIGLLLPAVQKVRDAAAR